MENIIKKSFWNDKNIFITGCTGFLGSWLTKSLLEKSGNVIGLIRDWVPKSNLILQDSISKINTVRGEVEDYFLLERILNEYEIDTVFHLAAQTIVSIANQNPISTFETNVKGTWNLLEACRKNQKVKRIIIASSDKAYGEHKKLPYQETASLKGSHPYDVSKSCADLISYAFFNTYKLPICITRCGNFYGGGDLNFNRIIPGTIKSLINNERPIIRSDGKYIRDYIYIKDAVEAYLNLAEKMEDNEIHGEAFNFSNESQVTVIELVEMIIKLMKKNMTPKVEGQVKGEIKHQFLSAEKARKKLKWKPKYGLKNGLIDTIKWYKIFLREVKSNDKWSIDKAVKNNSR